MSTKTINRLPSPTFRWLKVNNAELPVIESEKKLIDFKVSSGEKEVLVLDINKENYPKSTELNIEFELADNSEATIIELIRIGNDNDLVSEFKGIQNKNSTLNIIQLVFSGKEVFINVENDLKEDGAIVNIDSAYSLSGSSSLDINYVINHYGKKTECDITTKGVLYKGATKVYRGTIDFKHGCKGAKGNETEDVLLMDEDVVNKTVPVILCAEEDVEGNHGATIGKVNENLIFYFLNRGISEADAYSMLAKAGMESVIKLIEDVELKDICYKELG